LKPARTFTTKTEQAYWVLRRAIVTGEFGDWAPLDEVELMSRIDVGRTPIREAIKRLANEEFVVWHPHRTPHVRTTSADDLASLYEARQIFEVTAARLAAERATPFDLETLETLSDQLDTAIANDTLYEVAELDYDFHLALASASHNRFLVEAISHLNFGSLRLWYRSYLHLGIDTINDHHREQLAAIRRRDGAVAVSIAQAHIEFFHERQLRLFGLTHSAAELDIRPLNIIAPAPESAMVERPVKARMRS
jgi:DNA-binding GntR family transcriptional regulator